MSHKPVGVLLINLGTPESPTPKAVKQYLADFLGDKRVVDLPYLVRQVLLRAVILPTRPKKSARAYAQIWDPRAGIAFAISYAGFGRGYATDFGR